MLHSKNLLIELAEIGKSHPSDFLTQTIFPFEHYFDKNGKLLINNLDKNDGLCTRREILARYLLVSAVLDQGPDIKGVRLLVKNVINALYKKEIRIFHQPLSFFKELGISVDEILAKHDSIKKVRANAWARDNKSNPNKYSLFFAPTQQFTSTTKQVLDYAIYRWGVPLCIPLLLEKDLQKDKKESLEPLVDYFESYASAEIMSQQIKDNIRYGLGKSIGDKAAHLFAKWYIHSFNLVKNKENSWGKLSFELPLDSNVGRVLFRTGWLLNFASIKNLRDWEVIQKGQGKEGTHYIRVTNLRGKKSKFAHNSSDIFNNYKTICRDYLKTKTNPRCIEIQQIPNTLLLNSDYGIGDLDDGLMHIGVNMCLNLEEPKCRECPIKKFCQGYNKNPSLIKNYRT